MLEQDLFPEGLRQLAGKPRSPVSRKKFAMPCGGNSGGQGNISMVER
jgi:hypothetical protein